MSVSAISKALKTGGDVKLTRRLVLIALANYSDDEGYSWPKKSTLCRLANAGATAVDEAVAWLESAGYIERVVNGFAGRQGDIPVGKRPNIYRLHIDDAGEPTGSKTTREAPVARGRGPRIPGSGGPRIPGGEGSPDSGDLIRHSEPSLEKPPLTPPLGGLEPPPSPSPPQVAADRRKAKAAADSNDLVVGWVRSLFEHWPGGRKGKADAAQRAVRSAIAEGWTMSEIQERLDTYKAWRQVYAEVWSVEAPLMHVSRFVNELRKQRTAGEELWVDAPTPAAVADRWPPPRGHSWERALAKVAGDGRRLSREDMLELDRAGLLDDDPPADALPALLAQLRSSTATQEAIHG